VPPWSASQGSYDRPTSRPRRIVFRASWTPCALHPPAIWYHEGLPLVWSPVCPARLSETCGIIRQPRNDPAIRICHLRAPPVRDSSVPPLAFVGIANEKSGNGEQTHEEAMLEASRKELDEQVPKALKNSSKYRRGIYFFVEDYIIEPIATGLRFLHLVIIFVPVIVTIPAIWLGQRLADKDNERSGTIWWYGFLVSSMERAGAAFIKVGARRQPNAHTANPTAAWAMGSLQNRRLSHADVSRHVHSPLERTRPLAQSIQADH
jgi:hypothetical protein